MDNPELHLLIEEKNAHIQGLTHKLKHLDTVTAQLHLITRRCKATEYLLEEVTNDLVRAKLKDLNKFPVH